MSSDEAHALAQPAARGAERRRAARARRSSPPTPRRRAAGAARAAAAAGRRAPRPPRSRCARDRRRGRGGRRRPRPASPPRTAPGRSAGAARPCCGTTPAARRGGRRTARRSAARPGSTATRSAGRWNVPTFSARLWRSATDDALGANGSCTCTKSSSEVSSSSSIVREMSTGRLGTARRGASVGSSSPTARTPGSSPLKISLARMRLRDARTALGLRARGDDHDPVAARRQPLAQRPDVGVDLVRVLPRVRRDLGDRVGTGHQASLERVRGRTAPAALTGLTPRRRTTARLVVYGQPAGDPQRADRVG